MEEEDININWEVITPEDPNKEVVIDEQQYASLYDELLIKCNPDKYLNDDYNYNLSKETNKLYERVLKSKDDITTLMNIRAEAILRLGVVFSTVHIYNHLLNATNPEKFTNEHYDAQKFTCFNQFHNIVRKNKNNIEKLEQLYIEFCNKEKLELSLFNGRENEIIEYYYKEREREKREKEQEKIDKEAETTGYIIAAVSIITIIIIIIAIVIANS